ncbi:MAG: rod shape-determining protein MreD [Bacteroidetes bacterium]|nr:rod shape-determining protein MreD [Bacteroidota bacterium]
MSRLLMANIIRFIVLIPIQVLVLDNINLGGHVNPYLYVFFILLLPFETPGWIMLMSSFALGLIIDLFSGTPGMHAAASTLMAYARPIVIRSVGANKEFETGMQPSIRDLGFQWFFTYSFILIFLHHFSLLLIEVFRFSRFFDTLQRALLSTLFTLLLVIITQFIFMKTTARR